MNISTSWFFVFKACEIFEGALVFEVLRIYEKSGKKVVRIVLELPEDVYLAIQDLSDYLGVSPADVISELVRKRWGEIFSEQSSEISSEIGYSSVLEKFVDLISKLEAIVSAAETYGVRPRSIVEPKSKIEETPKLELSPLVAVSNAETSEEEAPDLDQVLDSVAVVVVDDSLLNALKANESKTAEESNDSGKDGSNSANQESH